MAYNDVFGGGSINPAQRTYLMLTISADVQLQWPIEQQIGGDDVAVDIIDIDATQPGLNVDFEDARQVSTGYTTLFTNIGSNTVTIRDAGGGTIISLAPGEAWFIYLTDNSTEAGVWRTFQLGATVSVANASALAGAGLKAISTTLNQTIPPTLIDAGGSPLNMDDADRAQLNIWNAGVGEFNLPDPGTVGSDWFTYIRNDGTGVLTVNTPAGVIDDGGSLMLNPGVSGTFVTDGTDWFTIGLTSASDTGFDFTEIDVSGSGDFVLSGVQLDRVAYRFIGTLTGDRNIVVPNTIQEYWVDNSTTGSFSLFVNTAAQVTPVEIPVDNRVILYCDGTDVLDAESSSVTFPITIAQGGTGATTAPGARTNLGVPPLTRLIDTGIGLTGGGDLSSDRTHDLEYVNISAEVPAAGDFVTFQDIDDSDAIKKATITDILAAVPVTSAEELIDSSANVRVRAETLGIAQLRSDGNVDAEVRLLEFAHSDGTSRGFIGQPTAAIDFIIASGIAGANLLVVPSSTGEFQAEINGNPILRVLPADVRIRGLANNDAGLFWTDTSGAVRGFAGYDSNAVLTFANRVESASRAMRFEGEATGPVTRTMMELDPDNDCAFFDEGVEVLRTRTPAQGGAQANNTITGAGFERVLTESDIPGGGGVTGQVGAKAYRASNTPVLTTDVETVVALTNEAYDTGGFHVSGGNNSRMTIPADVSIIILTAYCRFSSFLNGGKRVRIRKNGGFGSIDDNIAGAYIPGQVISGGVGQDGEVQCTSGEIAVAENDYFEMTIESLNQTGVVGEANNVWLELEVVET